MRILFVLFFACLVQAGRAQWAAGKVLEERRVKSAILHKDVRYSVYLPPDYSTSERSYPVVYLLHGYSDDNTGWLQFGEINRLADKAIGDGTIPPMIIIMPNGDSSWYINSYDSRENYEDFFVREFMPEIEKTYRILAEKRYRGIAGLSMGGFGTLIYLLKHPDLFAAGGALSAAIFDDSTVVTLQDGFWDQVFAPLFGRGLKGKDRLSASYYANSPLKIVADRSADELRKVRYWIDCGDDDGLSKGNCLLHIAMQEKHVAHEFRVRDGAHTWTYWRSGIIDALAFIGQSFHQQ
jgi:enterochelin esterase-like enzyme